MKLATMKNGTRDGQLVMVSRDLTSATDLSSVVKTFQEAIDHWDEVMPKLKEIYKSLFQQKGKISTFPLKSSDLMAPLPRAYHWADGSAYVNHVELVRKARGATLPESFWQDPLIYQGGSDDFIGPNDDIECLNEEWGIDFESEVAVITDDVPMGVTASDAKKHIKFLMLVNDVSLRNLIPEELNKGFGFYQSKPSTAFSPVAVTVDELGDYFDGHKVQLPLTTYLNGKLFGSPFCHIDMVFDFPQLISHAAKTRNLRAGTIIGSGTISNVDRSRGSSCLAEKRMLEKIESGEMKTAFLKHGDRVKIEMTFPNNESIFGAIDQKVAIKEKR